MYLRGVAYWCDLDAFSRFDITRVGNGDKGERCDKMTVPSSTSIDPHQLFLSYSSLPVCYYWTLQQLANSA